MISSFKVKSLHRLLLLLISFALLSFLAGCGGSLESSTTEAGAGSISLQASVSSLTAGKSSILTATVTDGTGSLVSNQAVEFSFVSNRSGAAITTLNGGVTDSTGKATAIYTAGSTNSNTEVQDNIQAGISKSSTAITITRESSSSATTSLHIDGELPTTSAAAGGNIIITAVVKDNSGNPASGQAVSFAFLTNNSGATLTVVGTGVSDNDGHAIVIYKAGANTPESSVQDTIQLSIPGSSIMAIITRTAASATATGTRLALSADLTSLTAGNNTLVRAKLTSGSTGSAIVGTAVTFSFATNNSGGTLTPLNGGITDSSGEALATYTAGSNTPASAVQDILQASVTGATGAVIITRTSSSGASTGLTLTLTSSLSSLEAGDSCILTATVTGSSGAVAGQTVTFSFLANPNGSDLSSFTATTDASGVATTVYTAGSATASTAQDVIQASVTGSTKAIIITKSGSAASVSVYYLELTATNTTIKSDGSLTSTITVHALNNNYAEIPEVEVTMGVSSFDVNANRPIPGLLSASTVTTPGTVTLSTGSNKYNRSLSVTAEAGGVSAVPLAILVDGSTVTLTTSGSTLPDDGTSPLTLTATVKSGSTVIPNVPVTFTVEPYPDGSLTISDIDPLTGNTDSSGQVEAKLYGTSEGTVRVWATALGASSYTELTVTETGNILAIEQQRTCTSAYTGCALIDADPDPLITDYNPNPASLALSKALELQVNVPASVTDVVFATSVGKFTDASNPANSGSTITVAKGNVTAGKATAYITTSNIGVSSVHVAADGDSTKYDTLTVTMTSDADPAKIFLQAEPTVVPRTIGSTTGTSTVTATVYDSSNYPLVGKWVAFSLVGTSTTSGGEKLSQSIAITDTTGKATTTFTSGTEPSASSGVRVHAKVLDASILPTVIETEAVGVNVTSSGNDVAIVIGGLAASIAFGQATAAETDETDANYIWPMSVVVADANGNAVEGATVSLGIWPIAWNTGGLLASTSCTPDTDAFVCTDSDSAFGGTIQDCDDDSTGGQTPGDGILDTDSIVVGWFWNEDRNENLISESTPLPVEDGWRCFYADSTKCASGSYLQGTKDTRLTPINSQGGTLPATVVTDANGVAGFKLTYPKESAIWTRVRIRATTTVQGSETRAEVVLDLPIVANDVCKIQCPYVY